MQEPVLFSVFITDLDNGINSMLINMYVLGGTASIL